MEAIYIPRLTQAPERSETIEFKEILPNLPTLTPVQGVLKVTHQGNYLEVSAQAETIVTLMCHRCLQQFNHRLSVSASEMLWLTEKAEQVEELPLDRDLSMEDLIETLPPNGYFEPSAWLYEQLCLEIPQRQICDQDCKGIEVQADSKPAIDQRWASLESLKGQLPS
ncbi:YceD family protein [Phormidesmis priestleyi]